MPVDSLLTHTLAHDRRARAVFSDASVIRAMLDVEAALARAEAGSGVIPA